ncbi:hypothetical protein BT69DRAFT_1299073 [Atractiella rhizophila]|nr:hypothetical protein BT69DRAFT_1299073 [Atractiella rhizophila]
MDRAKRGVLFILGAVSFLLTIYVNGFAFSFLNISLRVKEALWVLAKAGILFFMSRYSVGKTVKLRAVLAALVAYEAVVIATSAAVIYFTSSSSPIVFLQDADVSPAATPSPTTSVSFSYILPSVYFTAFAVLVRITSRLDYELSSSSPAVLLTSEPPFPVVHMLKKITSLRPKYSAMVAAVVIGVPAFLMNCAIPCLEKKNPSFASLKDEQMFMLLSFFTIVPVVTVALTLLAAVRGEIATVFSYEEKWALVEEQKAVEEDVDVERADEKN